MIYRDVIYHRWKGRWSGTQQFSTLPFRIVFSPNLSSFTLVLAYEYPRITLTNCVQIEIYWIKILSSLLGGCCGSTRKRTIVGGWAWAWWLVTDVQKLSLEVMTLNPMCEMVETAQGVALTVTGVAQVKIMKVIKRERIREEFLHFFPSLLRNIWVFFPHIGVFLILLSSNFCYTEKLIILILINFPFWYFLHVRSR